MKKASLILFCLFPQLGIIFSNRCHDLLGHVDVAISRVFLGTLS